MAYFKTAPLSIIDLPADEQHAAGLPLTPELIVIHATAGTDSRKHLSTSPASNVSIQRLITKLGTIYKIVDDAKQAHHVGKSRMGNELNLNDRALGIELENRNSGRDPYPDAQLRACAKQIVEWWGVYGYLPVVSHARIDTEGKTDPRGLDWPKLWRMVTEELRAALGGPAGPVNLVTIEDLQDLAKDGQALVQSTAAQVKVVRDLLARVEAIHEAALQHQALATVMLAEAAKGGTP